MAVNGYDTPYAPVARAPAVALDGEVGGGAALLGDGQRTTIGGAWLANSALFHGRAQQDTCGAAHFGAVLVLLLTAMIETWHYPLECLLPVLVTGYEAGGLLEKAYADRTRARRIPFVGDLRHDPGGGGGQTHGTWGGSTGRGASECRLSFAGGVPDIRAMTMYRVWSHDDQVN